MSKELSVKGTSHDRIAMDEWDYLASGEPEEAIRLATEAYDNCLSGGEMISLAGCQLLQRDWDAAYTTCRRYIDSPRWSTDSSFKYAGTAKWCAGDYVAAVAEWKQGIDVDYADLGGGITIPLHLFFAAASNPDLMPMKEAVELLQTRLQAKPRKAWPGYLARLLLGELSFEEAVAQAKEDVSHLWGNQRDCAETIGQA